MPDTPRPALDDVSKQIIEQLQQDGRRPYASIGKAVGLSEAAVRQRVQRMLDNGTFQIVAVSDPTQVGFNRQAMVGVRVTGELEPVVAALEELREVAYLVIVAGSVDLLVELICEDDDHLLGLLSAVRRIPGVTSIESYVYLNIRRELYDWGTR